MKKLLLSCAVAVTAAMSFTSCDKETCYTCELAATSACNLDICGGTSSSSNTACNATATAANLLYKSNTDLKNYFETVGYTCKAK